jgi:2'-5' RNA ligase
MYRLFVALDFPEQVRLELGRLCFGLKGAKWMTEDQLHLTVRFIGEVDGAVFRDIKEALQTVTAEPFDLELRGIGFFPPKRNPEILWVGTEKNPSLDHLRNKIESTIVRAGVPPEGRKFTPHVTLARLKETPVPHVARYIAQYGLFRVAPFPVSEFYLYSSFLGSEAAIHTIEATYELNSRRSRMT